MIEAFLLICIHWIADFVCQNKKLATSKWNSFDKLTDHTVIYSVVLGLLVFIVPVLQFKNISALFLFISLNLILHTIIDYFTSKIVHKKFENKQYGAFRVIGFDQVLHYGCLFFTYSIC